MPAVDTPPSGAESLMLAEIREQPDALERCLHRNAEAAQSVARHIRERDVRFAVIAARGTSDHAAIYAKYLLETTVGMPVALAAPSVWTLYGGQLDLRNALVVGVSQSGQGTDIVEVVRQARESGALTLGVTNFEDSLLADAAEDVLPLHAGLEASVAATKTYTTSLAALGLVVAALCEDETLTRELRSTPDSVAAVLGVEAEAAAVAERYRYMTDCTVVARGLNQCTALEAGLKLSETCYLMAHAYSWADFQHGPIAVVDDGFPCLMFNPEGKAHAQMLALADTVRERGAERLMFAHDAASLAACERGIRIPVSVPERVSPIVYIVAAQLFAYALATHKGYDPDKPRGLQKVTLTR